MIKNRMCGSFFWNYLCTVEHSKTIKPMKDDLKPVRNSIKFTKNKLRLALL